MNGKLTQEERDQVLLDKLFMTLDEVIEEPKEYLFRPYIPIGKITGINAIPGTGKTKFGDGLAAHVTAGTPLCDGLPCGKSGPVIIFSQEDDAVDHEKTVMASGGVKSKLHVLRETDEALDWLSKNPLTFSSPIVETAIRAFKPVLVIFDPIQKFMGSIDSNSQTATSVALTPLVKLARKYHCAIVLISHAGKGNDNSLQAKAIGSTNIVGMMRSMLSIVPDPEYPEENIAIHTKSNNVRGESIRFKILPIPDDEDFAEVHFVRTEKYTERDYRRALKQVEQKRKDAEITEDDPVVSTITHLAEQNNGFVRICQPDLAKAVDMIGGDTLTDSMNDLCKKYGNWLLQNRGIAVSTDTPRDLRPFHLSNTTIMPSKLKARVFTIKKINYTSQPHIF